MMTEETHRAKTAEFDSEADAWYLKILDEPVHHTTTGIPVTIDWTRDGTMIGVELLPGANPQRTPNFSQTGSSSRDPRVFFPGDTVPAGRYIVNLGGAVINALSVPRRIQPGRAYVEIVGVPVGDEWQAIVDRARREREYPDPTPEERRAIRDSRLERREDLG